MPRNLRRRIRAWAFLAGALSLANCALLLDLSSFEDECPEIAEGKPCPTVELCRPGEVAACYTGLASTQDHGNCHGGQKRCGSNGLFGPCEGEQVPVDEVCGNGLDEDCNDKPDDNCPCTPDKSYVCYSATKDTQNVGQCKEGHHVCLEDGMSFGACEGEVTPKAENYDKKGDENCDGIPSAETLWVQLFKATDGTVVPRSVAADASGNVFVAGTLNGTATVDGETMTSNNEGAFLAKLDGETGALIWLNPFPELFGLDGGSPEVAFNPANGHVLMSGAISTAFDFGAPDGPAAPGVFVVAFDGGGDPVWSHGCAPGTAGGHLAIDPEGNVAVLGFLKGTATCGTKQVSSASTASQSVLVAQFDAQGTAKWAKAYGDTSTSTTANQGPRAIAAGSDGTLWITGAMRGHVQYGLFAETEFTATGTGSDTDIFLLALDSSGATKTAAVFGDAARQEGASLAVGANGNVYLTASNAGAFAFDELWEVDADGLTPVVYAAFDSGAQPLWVEQFGANARGHLTGIQFNDDVVIAGGFGGRVNLGSGDFLTDAAYYAYLGRLDQRTPPELPKLVWAHYYGGDKTDSDTEIHLEGSVLSPRTGSKLKDVVLAGVFVNTADLGQGVIGAPLTEAGYVIKVAP